MKREEVKREILNALARGSNVLLTAPTGWGKTTLAVEIIKELANRGRGVVYIAPTLTLVKEKVWPLLHDVDSVILTGGATAPGMCPRGHRWHPQKFCRRCELKKNHEIKIPSKVSFEDLVTTVPEDVCPYWVQRSVEQRFTIRLGHFGRVRNLYKPGDLIIIDEFHEMFQPTIVEIDLADFGLDDVGDLAILKEKVEKMMTKVSDEEELERLAYLYDALLKPAVWLEEGKLFAAEIRELNLNPQPQIFALTATPPPEFLRSPPAGWELIRIEEKERPKAYLYDTCFYYNRYADFRGEEWLAKATRPLYEFNVKKLEEYGEVAKVAIFATSSLQKYLPYTPLGDLVTRGFADVFESWGRYRTGVDLVTDRDGIPYVGTDVFWSALHLLVRRAMNARGMDPSRAELINSVQLAGRIRRKDRFVVFADCRFKKHEQYLSEFYVLEELPS